MKTIDGDWYPPPEIREAIDTPHEHEHPEHNRPCWMIWVKGEYTSEVWIPGCICSSAESAEYHYFLAVQGHLDFIDPPPFRLERHHREVRVDRVPMDHAFGTEMLRLVEDHNRKTFIDWAERTRGRR